MQSLEKEKGTSSLKGELLSLFPLLLFFVILGFLLIRLVANISFLLNNLQGVVSDLASRSWGGEIRVGEMRINPWRSSLLLRSLLLNVKGSPLPLASVEEVEIVLSFPALLSRKDLSQSIKGVIVKGVRFHLVCNEEGKWNLPPSKPPKPPTGPPPSFPIKIKDIGGDLTDRYLTKRDWRIAGNALVLLQGPSTRFRAEGFLEGAPFHFEGERKLEDLRLRMSVNSLPFSSPYARGIGTLSLLFSRKEGKNSWNAQLQLRNASFSHKRLPSPIEDCSLHFIGNEKICEINHLSTRIGGISIRDGKAIFSLEKPYFLNVKADIQGKTQDILRLSRNLPKRKIPFPSSLPNLQFQGKLIGKGSLKKPYIEAELDMSPFAYRGLRVKQTHLKCTYYDDFLKVEERGANAGGGEVMSQFLFDFRSRNYALQGDLKHLDLSALPTNIKEELQRLGKLETFPEGIVDLSWVAWGDTSHPPSIGAFLRAKEFKFVNVFFKNLYSKLTFENGALGVERAYVEDDKGKFAFTGTIDTRTGALQGTLEGADVDLNRIAQLARVRRVSGIAYLRGKVGGTLSRPLFQGGVEVFQGKYRNFSLDQAILHIQASPEGVEFPEVEFIKGVGRGTAKGRLDISKRELSLEGKVENLFLPDILPKEVEMNGIGEARFSIKGDLSSPIVEVQGEARDGDIKGWDFQKVEGLFHWSASTGIVEGGRMTWGNSEVDFSGAISRKSIDIAVVGEKILLQDLPLNREIGGEIKLEGRVKGSLSSPFFEGNASGVVAYKGKEGNLQASLWVGEGTVRFPQIEYRVNGGRSLASLSYDPKTQRITGNLHMEDIPADFLSGVIGVREHFPQKGLFSAELALNGTLKEPELEGVFRGTDLANEFFRLSLLKGRCALKGKEVSFSEVEGEEKDMKVTAEGRFNYGEKQISLDCDASNFPLPMLTSFFPGVKLEGKGNVSLILEGSTLSPQFTASFNAKEVKIKGVDLEDISLVANYQGEVISLDHLSLLREGKALQGEGKLGFNLRKGFLRDRPLNIAMHWEEQDIGWLKEFLPFIEEIGGQTSGEIEIGGTIDKPSLRGYADFKGCNAKPKGFGEGLKNADVRFLLKENKAIVEKASFAMGKGSGSLNGSIEWTKEGLQMALTSTLDGVEIRTNDLLGYKENFRGLASGSLNIDGPILTPSIKGTITLSHSILDVSSYKPKAPGKPGKKGLFNPLFSLNTRLGANCWFISSGARALVEGSANLQGTLGYPRVEGHFTSRSGTIVLSSYLFRLSEATVDLYYLPGVFNLNVLAQARTTLGRYKITADIMGPYNDLQLRFTSSPPLPQKAIMAMFVPQEFQTDPEAFLKQEIVGAFTAGLQLRLLAPLEFALAQAMGLEEISFEYAPEKALVVNLREEILKDTYISYSRWLSAPIARYVFKIERRLGGNLFLYWSTDEQKRESWGIEGGLRF